MSEPFIERRNQMFPQLTAAQLERVSSVGERRTVRAGQVLFEPGEQNTSFFVVIEGAIAIVRAIDGRDETVTVHGPGQFTGEINMLSARRALLRGRVVADGSMWH